MGVEHLPDGSAIITREAWKALSGLPFRYFREGDDEDTELPGVSPGDRNEYFGIFIRCELFGLPHGKGWADEPEWLVTFLEGMKHKKSAVEAWISRGRK